MRNEFQTVYLRQHRFLEQLPATEIEKVSRLARLRVMGKAERVEMISGTRARIYFLVSGKLKLLEQNRSGEEKTKELFSESAVFGELSLKNFVEQSETVVSLTNHTVVASLAIEDFRQLLQLHPDLSIRFVGLVHEKLKRLRDRHAALMELDTKDRLLLFMKQWAIEEGSRQGESMVWKNYLTHRDIADFISASRQSVNSLLNELRMEGKLRYSRQRIEWNA